MGFNDNSVTMGSWGQGARSALPMVGEVFQQAVRNHWIDARVEFPIPRQRPRAPEAPPPAAEPENPVLEVARRALHELAVEVLERIEKEPRQ